VYTVSQQRLDMLRTGGGTVYGYVQAYNSSGVQITVPDESGRQTSHLPLQTDGSNQVPVDGTSPGPRRTFTGTLAPLPGLFDALSQGGVELHAFTAIEYLDGTVETEPQGVFDVDVAGVGYAANGNITITAPDRWQRIVNAEFLVPRASTKGATVRAQIASLLTEVLPAGTAVTDTSTSTATVPAQTWDQDRAQTIKDLANSAGLDVGFDRTGTPFIRDVPVLDPTNVALTIDASETGILIDGNRERSRQKTKNVVVITGTAADGSTPFTPQVVWDNDSTSLTYAGPGAGYGDYTALPPASEAGPLGQRITRYSSPLVTTTEQAITAGQAILSRVTGLAAQLTLTSVPAPFLDDGDTIVVVLPPTDPLNLVGVSEVHIVDGFTVPLVPHRNPMPLTTRSTRPDDVQES
jgi:hypothetical protein